MLFLCGGNTCRSPLASALLSVSYPELRSESAGIYPGPAAEDNAITVAWDVLEVDISKHQPRSVTSLDLADYRVVIAMEPGVTSRISSAQAARIGLKDTWDIDDPFGRGLPAYEACLDQIEAMFPRLLGLLKKFARRCDSFGAISSVCRDV